MFEGLRRAHSPPRSRFMREEIKKYKDKSMKKTKEEEKEEERHGRGSCRGRRRCKRCSKVCSSSRRREGGRSAAVYALSPHPSAPQGLGEDAFDLVGKELPCLLQDHLASWK